VPALGAQSPEFRPQSHQKKRKKEQVEVESESGRTWQAEAEPVGSTGAWRSTSTGLGVGSRRPMMVWCTAMGLRGETEVAPGTLGVVEDY
jgi:hypothetical protein